MLGFSVSKPRHRCALASDSLPTNRTADRDHNTAPSFEALEPRLFLHGMVFDAPHDHAAVLGRSIAPGLLSGPREPGAPVGDDVVGEDSADHDAGNGGADYTYVPRHYFPATDDGRRFAWADRDPSTPDVVDIFYDFRKERGYKNKITAEQKEMAVAALNAWSQASGGKLNFIYNAKAPRKQIINIGTGNLKAVDKWFRSEPSGTLGLGGGNFKDNAGRAISRGIAWMDVAENWDTTIGNGDPEGTFDYFTIVGQEIGHALGLGHLDDLGGENIMNGFYQRELTAYSRHDAGVVQSIYGQNNNTEPALATGGGRGSKSAGAGSLLVGGGQNDGTSSIGQNRTPRAATATDLMSLARPIRF